MIIHIAGTPGSGKTHIGNLFKKSIKVIDTDDWRDEFYNSKKIKNASSYLKFIYSKVDTLDSSKNCLLVGVLDDYINKSFVFPQINADKKIFLKISIKKLFIQRNTRLINNIVKHKEKYLNMLSKYKNPHFLSLDDLKNEYKKDYILYSQEGYTPLSYNQIVKYIERILFLSKD